MRNKKRFSLLLSCLLLTVSLLLTLFPVSAAGPTVTATLTDNSVQKGSKKTFEVRAENSAGAKIKATVKFNGQVVAPTWEDSEKTSYTLIFTREGENIVTVSASSDGGRKKELKYHITYEKAEAGEQIGTATWSVELFTIGCGYLIYPVSVPIYEGETSAEQLIRLLHGNGFVGYYGGTPESAFYLSYIADGTVSGEKYNNYRKSGTPTEPRLLNLSPKIPQILVPQLEDTMSFFDQNDYLNNWQGYIGEFVFTNGSGWMYSVNNIFPNVGFSDTYLSDGDVVRVQYTLGYGADIGGLGSVGGNIPDAEVQPTSGYFPVADKDELSRAICRALTFGDMSKKRVKAAYDAAISVMETLDASQSSVALAVNALNDALQNPGTESVLPETQPATDAPQTAAPEVPPEFVGPVKPPAFESESVEPSVPTVPSDTDRVTGSEGDASDPSGSESVTDRPSASGGNANKPSGSESGASEPSGSESVSDRPSASGGSVNKPSGSENGSDKPSGVILPSAPSSVIGVFRPSASAVGGDGQHGSPAPSAPGSETGIFKPLNPAGIIDGTFGQTAPTDGDAAALTDIPQGTAAETAQRSDTPGLTGSNADLDGSASGALGEGGDVSSENTGTESKSDEAVSGGGEISPKLFMIAGASAAAAAAVCVILFIRFKQVKRSAGSESEGEDRND